MFVQSSCVIFLSAFVILVNSEIHWDCLGANVEKCENTYREAVACATKGGQIIYEDICRALENVIDCAQIDCGGEAWDPTDDFLTKLNDYMKVTGLCGEAAQTQPCAVQLSKDCTQVLAAEMDIKTDPCEYYGQYALCIIKDGPQCDDSTTASYVTEMRRQVNKKMPTVFGSTTVDMCPNWPDV